jgi:hypothetical protein
MQRSQIEIFSNIIEEVPMKLADLSAPITCAVLFLSALVSWLRLLLWCQCRVPMLSRVSKLPFASKSVVDCWVSVPRSLFMQRSHDNKKN